MREEEGVRFIYSDSSRNLDMLSYYVNDDIFRNFLDIFKLSLLRVFFYKGWIYREVSNLEGGGVKHPDIVVDIVDIDITRSYITSSSILLQPATRRS